MKVEITRGDFRVECEIPEEALVLNWKNLSDRYLIPCFGMARHIHCNGKSAIECAAEYPSEYTT